MPPEPIRYYHRYKKTVETEQVYGGKWLRWTYGTVLGRAALGLLVKRAFVSRYYGWKMSQPGSANQILPFIVDYNLDVDEFAKKPFAFKTFNEFFYRALKDGARPIATDHSTGSPQAGSHSASSGSSTGQGDRVAVLPADGRHLAFQTYDATEGFYAKGQRFDLAALFGDPALATEFGGGSLLISRLCPVDYHRFHFPVNGTPGEPRLINGWLYSVSPIALRQNLAYLWENKRMVTLVESPGRAVGKGEEKGLFKFGGSCVVTLFKRGRIKLDADLVKYSAEGLEVYGRMGDRLGAAV